MKAINAAFNCLPQDRTMTLRPRPGNVTSAARTLRRWLPAPQEPLGKSPLGKALSRRGGRPGVLRGASNVPGGLAARRASERRCVLPTRVDTADGGRGFRRAQLDRRRRSSRFSPAREAMPGVAGPLELAAPATDPRGPFPGFHPESVPRHPACPGHGPDTGLRRPRSLC